MNDSLSSGSGSDGSDIIILTCTSGSAIMSGWSQFLWSLESVFNGRAPPSSSIILCIHTIRFFQPCSDIDTVNTWMPFLKSTSPKALETASSPMTRLLMTKPPASRILLDSSSLVGLWSCDRRIGLNFLREIHDHIQYIHVYVFSSISSHRRYCMLRYTTCTCKAWFASLPR